ncbi:MAG TPA: ATP-binding protein [Polyangiaceae bacterium]|nr:ATP-binding protein [Polyangiaceae bacterium]
MKLDFRAKLFAISTTILVPLLALAYGRVHADVVDRLNLTAADRESVLALLNRSVASVAVVAIFVAFVLSSVGAGIASRTARALAAAARKMADGDVESIGVVHGEDEFGELGAALDQLARSYSTALGDFRRERDRMRGILSGMREGLLLLDRGRRVALVNPALREMLLLGADVEGKSPLEIIRHAELVHLLDEVEEVDEPASGEIEIGGLKPRRLFVQVVRIPGEEGGLLAVFVDVTHLRRLETLRKDFVANASHELRTPVAAILSAAETLDTAITRDPPAAKDFVALISRNATRLKNLVDDLLDLSRIESQDFEVRLEPLDADELSGAVLDLFRERASKKGIRLLGAGDLSHTVLADRRGLEHVLTNLIDNAVKYCGPGSTVSVHSEDAEAGIVRIFVEDDGPGIEKQHLPRIFERFYRVDPGRSRQLGGTGLGLSIVKHLVEAMGGHIEVESEPQSGTRFRITLGRADPVEQLPPRMTNAPPAA